jgi:hypothetical protein
MSIASPILFVAGAVALLAGCARAPRPIELLPASLAGLPGAQPAYLVLDDGRVLVAEHWHEPKSPYLVGVLLPDGTFRTELPPRVEGLRPTAVPFGYVPGWFEISTRTFHRDMDARAPVPPVVRGWFDAEGRFTPGEAALATP